MSRRVMINLIAFLGVFVLMLWWAVNNIITFDFIERPYTISGEFAATAGVSENSEVAYLGVSHGSVRSVDLVEGKVVITMEIDRGKQIPAGSVARIFRKSAVGEPYIDFQPPEGYTGGGPYIEAGTVIPLERTTVPLEFSELLRSASRVLGAVEPEQTRTLIHELAVALNGRGDALRSLTVDSDALLQTFADRTELLDRLSANSTKLTRTVTEHRESLSSSISDLADLSSSLRSVEPDTRVLLDRGTELLGEAADLVSDIEPDVNCILSDLDEVITATTTDEQLSYLVTTLEDAATGFGYVFMTRDTEPGGLWVRVNVVVTTEGEPAETYAPPHQLPAVPEVPPCVTTGSGSSAGASASGVRGLDSSTAHRVALDTVPAASDPPLPAIAFWLAAGLAVAFAARRKKLTP